MVNNMTTQRTTRAQFLQRKQVADFRRGEHYERVLRIGTDRKQEEKRGKRIDLIVVHGIRKDVVLKDARGNEFVVQRIDSSGIITTKNGLTLDPLDMW